MFQAKWFIQKGHACRYVVPRQIQFNADLRVINDCLDGLINQAKRTQQVEDIEALQARDYSKVPPRKILTPFLHSPGITSCQHVLLASHSGCAAQGLVSAAVGD